MTDEIPVSTSSRPFSFTERLREISMFFDKDDRVHRTMRNVASRLESARIDYAIVGGMAVFAHQHAQTTNDVDFLVTLPGFSAFVAQFVPGTFKRVVGRPRRFIDPETTVTFDFIVVPY